MTALARSIDLKVVGPIFIERKNEIEGFGNKSDFITALYSRQYSGRRVYNSKESTGGTVTLCDSIIHENGHVLTRPHHTTPHHTTPAI